MHQIFTFICFVTTNIFQCFGLFHLALQFSTEKQGSAAARKPPVSLGKATFIDSKISWMSKPDINIEVPFLRFSKHLNGLVFVS